MRRILVADDHAITRRGLRSIVREIFGAVEVVEAEDSASVLQLATLRGWDLILLDVVMPGGIGILDLLREIRAHDAKVPILVITATTELSFVMQSMQAGANGLVHKHLPPGELMLAIGTVAGGGTYLHADTAASIARSLNQERELLPHERLSQRELEIMRLLASGRAVKEVAGLLAISEKTVATYIARIRQKTGLISSVDMARYALQHALVD